MKSFLDSFPLDNYHLISRRQPLPVGSGRDANRQAWNRGGDPPPPIRPVYTVTNSLGPDGGETHWTS
jgi:hypothetical protein